MRHLSIRATGAIMLVFAILGSHPSFGQSGGVPQTPPAQQPGTVRYADINYQKYQQGIVVDSTKTVHGILLRDDHGIGKPIAGMELTILGGNDFVAEVVTDKNGAFVLKDAQPGSYTVYMDNDGVFGSLDFKVTASDPAVSATGTTTSSLGPNTGVNNWLVLVVEENGMLRFAATRGSTSVLAASSAGAAAAGAVGGGMGGAMSGAGLLGAAGLAGGIAALATSGGGGHKMPVSPGAPGSR